MENKQGTKSQKQSDEHKNLSAESELPTLKEMDRRVPFLPHDEKSEDAWV